MDMHRGALTRWLVAPFVLCAWARGADRPCYKVVARGVDVVKESGGRYAGLVKALPGIVADKLLTIEFVPRTTPLTPRTFPILSGIEIRQNE